MGFGQLTVSLLRLCPDKPLVPGFLKIQPLTGGEKNVYPLSSPKFFHFSKDFIDVLRRDLFFLLCPQVTRDGRCFRNSISI